MKKKNHFFYCIWSSSGSYTLTTLRRLVGNHDLSLKWTWSIMCQFQFKDFISIESCVWSWSLFHFHLLSGFWVKWHINNKHVPYLRKATKNQSMQRDKKCCIIEEQHQLRYNGLPFLKPNEILKWFLDLGKVGLVGNRTKKKRIYHWEMTNHLVLIL